MLVDVARRRGHAFEIGAVKRRRRRRNPRKIHAHCCRDFAHVWPRERFGNRRAVGVLFGDTVGDGCGQLVRRNDVLPGGGCGRGGEHEKCEWEREERANCHHRKSSIDTSRSGSTVSKPDTAATRQSWHGTNVAGP